MLTRIFGIQWLVRCYCLSDSRTDNSEDSHAVAVLNEDVIVGHIPYNLAPIVESFLRRDVNKGFAQVTGNKVNRGAGYGLEIPCVYRLYRPKIYCDKLEELLQSLSANSLI